MWEPSLCSEPGWQLKGYHGVKGKTNNKLIEGTLTVRVVRHRDRAQRGCGLPSLGMLKPSCGAWSSQLCLALLSAEVTAPGHS